MVRKLALMLVFAAFALAATAQSPVRWRISVTMTSPDEGYITIKALIAEGWHLYGNDLPADGPKPTKFDFSDSNGIKITDDVRASQQPISQIDPVFGKKLTWWDKNVTFTVPFEVKQRSEAHIRIEISYMSCNGETCTPPKTEHFSLDLPEYKPEALRNHNKTL